jgi:hypothetical protein
VVDDATAQPDQDRQPARVGPEVFRTYGLVVRPSWDPGALEVVSTIGEMEIQRNLDPFEARDLVRALILWQTRLAVAGLAPAEGPREGG